MSKIKSFNELKDFADKLKPILNMRENHNKENIQKREILVCGGTGCTSADSIKIIENLFKDCRSIIWIDNYSKFYKLLRNREKGCGSKGRSAANVSNSVDSVFRVRFHFLGFNKTLCTKVFFKRI